ncbi:hypothetical protein CFO_g4 [Ceratocystis platani]|uniref:Uncharacterized protein n=1 Tax=Ceratocystis fimbriata f. sp. platani TaxID=88771 RepID=A0A0F8B5Z7_CERFI|nr:hypothetical protein CFO_g4 [Ceratocystis platani]
MASLRDTIRYLLFASNNDDLGKKNDDLPRNNPSTRSSSSRFPARRLSIRRLIILAFGVLILFTIFKALTARHDSPDSPFHQGARPHDSTRGNFRSVWNGQLPGSTPPRAHGDPVPGSPAPKAASSKEQNKPISGLGITSSHNKQTYNGPLKFNELASTLFNIRRASGTTTVNTKNVLFAAGDYKSAATLIPLACKMSQEQKNYVHFALVTKDEMPIRYLKEVNGVQEDCQVVFHDARPDLTSISTMSRMQTAAERALYHINMYMHPQAVIIDGSRNEEAFFLNGFRDTADALKLPLIELPSNMPNEMSFLTKLDSVALANWNKVELDIIIQAPSRGSGALIRLLDSLSQADFSGLPIPHLTIDLPTDVEAETRRFLDKFNWPPSRSSNPSRAHLHYSMLYYHYSQEAISQSWDKRVLGISLDYPETSVDGIEPFEAPEKSFLWESPTSNALLVFGGKWAEAHSLISNLINTTPLSNSETAMALIQAKTLGKSFPSWMEYLMLLSRARGYLTLYPGVETAATVAAVDHSLYLAPEEYSAEDAHQAEHRARKERVRLNIGSTVTSIDTLSNSTLPALGQMEIVQWQGQVVNLRRFNMATNEYTAEFRSLYGRCDSKDKPKVRREGSANDLFCFGTS